MPRVENIGINVNRFCCETDEGSSTFDLCKSCGQEVDDDPLVFYDDLVPYNGDPVGEQGHATGVEHPPYAETDYECEVCGKALYDEDN